VFTSYVGGLSMMFRFFKRDPIDQSWRCHLKLLP